jgi:hypothetical protein
LYNSIIKYGWEKHVFEVIHICTETELNELETFYIKEFNSFNTKNGLNLLSGGKHFKMSDETKRKISESSKGNTKWVGRKHSEESKFKMRLSQSGHTTSEEAKLKMSITRKGRLTWNKGIKHTEETKRKMSLSAPKHHSKEHTINSANAHRGFKMSNEQKLKISIACMGKQRRLGAKLSDETKEKIFQKCCYTYEIYDNKNELIFRFKCNFNNKMKELKLPQTSFRKSHQNNKKIPSGQYKDWLVVKL